MKKLIFLILFLLAIVLISASFVKAACSALPPSRPDYFSYIQECDNKLSLKLDLPLQRIAWLDVNLANAGLPTVFDANGVVSDCQVKEEGTRKSVSGREVPKLSVYCAGGELSSIANSYEARGAGISEELPRIAHSLRRFRQFLMEESIGSGLNIQNSIALDNEGRILGGKINFPASEDKHWLGGIIDDFYLAPETLQARGVSITFKPDRKTSEITFTDLLSYFVRESSAGQERYDVNVYSTAKYDNEKNTLTGQFRRDGKEFKNIIIGFVGSKTYICSLDVEEPNANDCIELKQTKDYYASATNPLRGIFSIGSIAFTESNIKGDNIEYNYPKTLKEAEALIKIPV